MVFGFEWMFQGTHFIHHTSVGPDIAFLIVRFLFTQLWREIAGCSHERVRKFRVVAQHACNDEVSNANLVVRGQENIQGFNVSVEDPVGVQPLEAEAYLYQEPPDYTFCEKLSPLRLQVPAEVAQYSIMI